MAEANPLEPFTVVPARKAVKYDGSNSAAIAAKIENFTVTGETTSALTFTSGGTSRTVQRGGYIDYAGGVVTAVYQNEDDLDDAVSRLTAEDHIHEVVLQSSGAKPMPAQDPNYP